MRMSFGNGTFSLVETDCDCAIIPRQEGIFHFERDHGVISRRVAMIFLKKLLRVYNASHDVGANRLSNIAVL